MAISKNASNLFFQSLNGSGGVPLVSAILEPLPNENLGQKL
jgi:hypothetical protein